MTFDQPRNAGAEVVPPRHKAFCLATLCGVAALVAIGCSVEQSFSEEEIKANLRQINKGYWMHLGFHKRPPDPEQLHTVLQDLHRLDMGNPAEQALLSPRDKQPLVIVYGADDSDPATAIMAYEQKGAEGTHWVVTMGGDIKQLTEDEFGKAAFAKKHKPGSGAAATEGS